MRGKPFLFATARVLNPPPGNQTKTGRGLEGLVGA
jgi:hypothetical protein